MKAFEKEVGQRIRELREKAGYSREKLSEMSGIGPKFLYEIETGKKGMSAYTLLSIAQALNVSCDYILTGKTSGEGSEYIQNLVTKMDKGNIEHIEQIIKHIAEMIK